ncbi:MAG: NAD-dependent epimerase/dehydratase family protein [bacterium]
MDIAIVGCGEISTKHIQFALDYPGARIVGLVDSNEEQARKRAVEFHISDCYTSLSDLFLYHKPQVAHILTPPASHLALVQECAEAGCNVLVEKPMGLNYQQALAMVRAAEKHGISLCVDHNHFFDPCMMEVRNMVERGDLGHIIYVESYYGWNTDIPAVRGYPRANEIPWIHNLPGGVFHDIITHPLSLLLEYTGVPREMKAMARSTGTLPQEQPDELRILCNGPKALGTLSISFNSKPFLHYLNLFGTEMFVQVNFDTMTFYTQPNRRLPKALKKPLFNLDQSWQISKRTLGNTWKFLRGKLRSYHGMRTLIHQFYGSIQRGEHPPLSKDQCLQVARVIDEIWDQVTPRKLVFSPILPRKNSQPLSNLPKVLITGASGFLGSHLARRLVREGYPVRALVRKLSPVEHLRNLDVEIFFGDVRDEVSLRSAIQGMEMIVHAAAATSGSLEASMDTTVNGTRNVLKTAQREGIKKVVYISSLSVYDYTRFPVHQKVREEDALEPDPQKRGAYTYSKVEAERVVQQFITRLPIVILRPGTIHGPGGPALTPMMGYALSKGLVIAIGSKRFELPLVYIDNLLDAIVFSLNSQTATGKAYNIVDEELITKHAYIQRYLHKMGGHGHVLYLPYLLMYGMTFGLELLSKAAHKDPFLTRYRLAASCKSFRFDISKAKHDLGWFSRVPAREGLENTLNWSRQKDHDKEHLQDQEYVHG